MNNNTLSRKDAAVIGFELALAAIELFYFPEKKFRTEEQSKKLHEITKELINHAFRDYEDLKQQAIHELDEEKK